MKTLKKLLLDCAKDKGWVSEEIEKLKEDIEQIQLIPRLEEED